MTKSTITRERLAKIAAGRVDARRCNDDEIAMAITLLAAMDGEPHTDDELSNLLWYSQEATCHSDPNYYCEFQRLATPGLIAGIIRELQERRKADSEPYGFTDGDRRGMIYKPEHADRLNEPVPLYRHAQQPAPEYPEVLPCPVLLEPGMRFGKGVKTRLVLDAIQRRAEHYAELEAMTPEERAEYDAGIEAFKAMLPQPAPVVPEEKPIPNTLSMYAVDAVAAIAEVKGWNACRAAMLAAAPQPQNAPQNIPEIIPNELIAAVNRLLDSNGSRGCYSAIKCYDAHIEVERLLAAAWQEVKP
ncbi:hypothetical protein [Klebsiella pneumoniae]